MLRERDPMPNAAFPWVDARFRLETLPGEIIDGDRALTAAGFGLISTCNRAGRINTFITFGPSPEEMCNAETECAGGFEVPVQDVPDIKRDALRRSGPGTRQCARSAKKVRRRGRPAPRQVSDRYPLQYHRRGPTRRPQFCPNRVSHTGNSRLSQRIRCPRCGRQNSSFRSCPRPGDSSRVRYSDPLLEAPLVPPATP